MSDPKTETTATATAAAEGEAQRKRAEDSNFLPIVRGRLPLIFVHAIRFDKVLNAMGNKDLATKFATSVGKVFDIKKGRNFGYVSEAYKPNAEDVAAAESWIGQVGGQNAKGLTANGDKSPDAEDPGRLQEAWLGLRRGSGYFRGGTYCNSQHGDSRGQDFGRWFDQVPLPLRLTSCEGAVSKSTRRAAAGGRSRAA